MKNNQERTNSLANIAAFYLFFSVVVVLLLICIWVVFKKGFFIGLIALLLLCIFVYIAWHRFGIINIFKDDVKTGFIHDVYQNQYFLRQFLRPYKITNEMLLKPIFLGMIKVGNNLKSLNLLPEVFHKNHVAIIGASGSGKSKIAALILVQLYKIGNSIIVFDPKNDEFLARVLNFCAKLLGREIVYVDLNDKRPQINPFYGTDSDDAEEILQAGLLLDPSGNPAVDFYRGEDRDACESLIRTGKTNIVDLIEAGSQIEEVTDRVNFWRELKMLGRVSAFHTNRGIDLSKEIARGSIIYIVGSTDNIRVVAAQRLLLARVFQIIKKRNIKSRRQVCIFLDEFKYSISNCVMRALGTIRDKKCNLIIAYQGTNDLYDSGGLDPRAVIGAAEGNTTLKFVYKLEDTETAKEFVLKAGKERIFVETKSKILDGGLDSGSWREGDRDAVSIDLLTVNMPKPMSGEASVCWVFGQGPAFPLSTMHLTPGDEPKIKVAKPVRPLNNDLLNAQSSIGFNIGVSLNNNSSRQEFI
mgnify:CR=1 FL=1